MVYCKEVFIVTVMTKVLNYYYTLYFIHINYIKSIIFYLNGGGGVWGRGYLLNLPLDFQSYLFETREEKKKSYLSENEQTKGNTAVKLKCAMLNILLSKLNMQRGN